MPIFVTHIPAPAHRAQALGKQVQNVRGGGLIGGLLRPFEDQAQQKNSRGLGTVWEIHESRFLRLPGPTVACESATLARFSFDFSENFGEAA